MMNYPNKDCADWRSAESLPTSEWLPLSALAVHGFGRGFDGRETIEQRIENLHRELSEDVLLDDVGIPHVRRSLARELFAERGQKQAAAQAREAARAAELAAKPNSMDQVRALIKAIDARDELLRTAGCSIPTMSAYERAAADDQATRERKGRFLDEMLRNGRDGT